MSDPRIPQRLLDLAKQAQAPRELSGQALRERSGELVDVEIQAGQVWRARWEDISVLVLILAIEGRDVRAAPVTIDPPADDDHSLVLEGQSTAFGVDTTVWAGLAGTVPIRVLERPVDACSDEVIQWTRSASEGRPGDVPAGARQGHLISSELDPAALARAEIADDLEALRQAPGLPAAAPGQQPRGLASLLGTQLDLASLCTALDLPQPEVMKILRGKAPLTAGQIEMIARVTGLTAERVAASVRPLPLGLVVRMEHPRWRHTWQERARTYRVSESEARLAGSYGAYSLAARQTGGGEPDWDERLRRFLRDEDMGPGGA
ncbi:MAG TPA: hypothetical protein VMV92_00425 [Streptosporangiaceae bacterium]|nr:hypothetical protein [Streptosporangiaceae bacterium]